MVDDVLLDVLLYDRRRDVLLGGYGTDQVFGGPGDDYVIAEPSRVEDVGDDDGYGPLRRVTHDPLPNGVQPQTKLLVGGLGRDHIVGGDGGSVVFGDRHLPAEQCADLTTASGQPTPTAQGDRDLILGGAGVEVVTAGGTDRRHPDRLGFAYRSSNLGPGEVVALVSFHLRPEDSASIRARLEEMRGKRREAQPSGIKTFGSTFKNPEDERAGGRSAGQLLEAAGCRGVRHGDARFSEKHANFV